ncbi:App1 family protein [Flavobacterium salilacus subsp. salilacus]|uniref:App1 family protein n=1 Tax=Flavobacterium TaxID=237 RepID=UPI00107575C1|nr:MULTISPECIES: App1 family protein [Flavobacterium]KAF2519864.1 App1 family protein [Flavobacterium salilacus subsp. salilacus]MBE1614232.1 App1 family protein [Flavobacterium sp. SaA2.13]
MKPILKLYRGYANEQELMVFGHVFNSSTASGYEFEKKRFKNARSVIKMFMVKTIANADVYLEHNGKKIHTKTLKDGYFKFCIPLKNDLEHGWSSYCVSTFYDDEEIKESGTYVRPFEGDLGFISDIDDTFLVSHTRNVFKKLYILLWKNINARRIFEGVVPFYQALSNAGRETTEEQNAFFYVSSSEWNLYSFIVKFTKIHELPRAVMLLKDIKTGLMDFLVTGRGNHNHKFDKIKHILEFYPHLKYTLLGDDSQHDPYLYESICKIFPVTVKAVYIRQTGRYKKQKVSDTLKNIETLSIETCYFKDSEEAILHAKAIGLIS